MRGWSRVTLGSGSAWAAAEATGSYVTLWFGVRRNAVEELMGAAWRWGWAHHEATPGDWELPEPPGSVPGRGTIVSALTKGRLSLP